MCWFLVVPRRRGERYFGAMRRFECVFCDGSEGVDVFLDSLGVVYGREGVFRFSIG